MTNRVSPPRTFLMSAPKKLRIAPKNPVRLPPMCHGTCLDRHLLSGGEIDGHHGVRGTVLDGLLHEDLPSSDRAPCPAVLPSHVKDAS